MQAVQSKDTTQECAVCPKTDELQRCSRCRRALYCGVEHQKADWKRHKVTCLRTFQDMDALQHAILRQHSQKSRSNLLYILGDECVRVFNLPAYETLIVGDIPATGFGIAYESGSSSLGEQLCRSVTFGRVLTGDFNGKTYFTWLSKEPSDFPNLLRFTPSASSGDGYGSVFGIRSGPTEAPQLSAEQKADAQTLIKLHLPSILDQKEGEAHCKALGQQLFDKYKAQADGDSQAGRRAVVDICDWIRTNCPDGRERKGNIERAWNGIGDSNWRWMA